MRRFSPLAQRRIRAFAANRRALTALVAFVAVFALTLLAELIANDRPLLLKYDGKLYFPVFAEYTEQEFGGDFPTPADYRDEFVRQNIEKNGWMIMPPVPFSFNTVDYDLTTPTPAPPSSRHWLGTDDEGRDIGADIVRNPAVGGFCFSADNGFFAYRHFRRCGAGVFWRQNRYFYAAVYGNMGIASAVVYFDYCRQYFRPDVLEPADYFDVFFLDIADRNGAGGVSARQKSGICKSGQGFGGRKRADYLPAYSAQCRGYDGYVCAVYSVGSDCGSDGA